MTCKDCYHHDACKTWINHGETLYSDYTYSTEDCPFYKDKSRIVELPCKVGDILYYPWVYGGTSGVAMLEVFSFKIYVQGRVLAVVKDPESDLEMPKQFHLEDFGKTVFLTREEAEEALRKEVQK